MDMAKKLLNNSSKKWNRTAAAVAANRLDPPYETVLEAEISTLGSSLSFSRYLLAPGHHESSPLNKSRTSIDLSPARLFQ